MKQLEVRSSTTTGIKIGDSEVVLVLQAKIRQLKEDNFRLRQALSAYHAANPDKMANEEDEYEWRG